MHGRAACGVRADSTDVRARVPGDSDSGDPDPR